MQNIVSHRSFQSYVESQAKAASELSVYAIYDNNTWAFKEVLYKENGCVFRFNLDCCYFSPRLSNERIEIASKIKKNDNVLVMFAGVAPYSIIIAKNSKAKKVFSNEINKEANKYAKLNVELNKLKKKVELVPGDIKKVAKKLKKKFDVIVMPRPKLKDTFLEQAFMLSKRGTRIAKLMRKI